MNFVLGAPVSPPAGPVSAGAVYASFPVFRVIYQLLKGKVRGEIRDMTSPRSRAFEPGNQLSREIIQRFQRELQEAGFIFDGLGNITGYMGPQWLADP